MNGKTYLDLDVMFRFFDADNTKVSNEEKQEYVDDDYIVLDHGDFFHHNTQYFLYCFWEFDKVNYIVINDKHYKCTGYTTAYTIDDIIYLDDTNVRLDKNNVIDFVTCQGAPGQSITEWEEKGGLRYIAQLEEIDNNSID